MRAFRSFSHFCRTGFREVNRDLFHNVDKTCRLRMAHNPPVGLCAFLLSVRL